MTKKVLVIESSPRKKGNSVVLGQRAAESLKEAGIEVETVHLHGMNIAPCNHCDGCLRKKVFCVVQDEMQDIYAKLVAADGLILSSPIYFYNFNAQLKTMIDRWYGIGQIKADFLKDKPIGVILTYADEDIYVSGGINAIQTFEAIFRWLRTGTVSYAYGSASNVGDAEKDAKLMESAAQLGKKMATLMQ